MQEQRKDSWYILNMCLFFLAIGKMKLSASSSSNLDNPAMIDYNQELWAK